MKPTRVVISCEHAVNTIPKAYLPLFALEQSVLQTHRAIDFGAQNMAETIGKTLSCGYTQAQVSRLLIDCNRTLSHPTCFSDYSAPLSQSEKQILIDQYYLPFRNEVTQKIQTAIDAGYQVIHLSIHSFTPVFNDVVRNADVGLLYDPTRHGEKEVARVLRGLVLQKSPSLRVRMNYPYDGKSDGFASFLRKQHQERDYLGFEIETNQALVSRQVEFDEWKAHLSHSLQELLAII